MAANERFLVTGALGCIGAWTVANLVREGASVTAFDLGSDPYRLRYLLDEDEFANVEFAHGDVTDLQALEHTTAERGITHIIHLAALQVPFCNADPPGGARVNVIGTVNVFEIARRQGDRIRQVVYASSVAVYGLQGTYPASPVPAEAALLPGTHYGVYKQANEGTARIYWLDEGVSSIGLRPYIVYGVGRDQGLTSGVSKAMLAAAAGRSFHIPHGGRADFQWADDVARQFIACARSDYRGASVNNLKGNGLHVSEVIAAIEAAAPPVVGKITYDGDTLLPFPDTLDDSSLATILGEIPSTPFAEGVQRTVKHFTHLVQTRRIDIEHILA